MSYRIDIGGTAPLDVQPIGWASVKRGDFATVGSDVTWCVTSAVEGHASMSLTYEVVRANGVLTWRGRKGWSTHTEYGKSACKYWRQASPSNVSKVTPIPCPVLSGRQ